MAASASAADVIGDAQLSLPGVDRVGIATREDPRVGLGLDLGYGYTEAQSGENGPHHRAPGALAVSVAPLPWFSLSVRGDARYDMHPDDALGSDDGVVIDYWLALRMSHVEKSIRLGLQLAALLPGHEEVGPAFGAVTPEGRALIGWTNGAGAFTLGANAGYRLARAQATAEDADRLRAGDRLALGVSEFDAVLAGVGAIYRHADTELLAEVSGDVLVGDGAPPFMQSPLRASGGFRHHVSDTMSVGLIVSGSLSERPLLGAGAPLVPIEPRVSALAGLRLSFDLGPKPADTRADEPVAPPPPPPPIAPALPPPAIVHVRVLDEAGAPLRSAEVEVRVGDRVLALQSKGEGEFELSTDQLGSATVVIKAPDYVDSERRVELGPGKKANLSVQLEPALPPGQLRGLIRSFGGKGLVATIRLSPLDKETQSDAEGFFQIDVPPGEYEVSIEASGYTTQRRKVKVEDQGVTVINVDLRRGK
jgi:hypothetical protein